MRIDLNKVESVVGPILKDLGFEIADLEWLRGQSGFILRFYIDRPEGSVSIADCQMVSHAIGPVLDVEDLIPGSYNLEVSSPGIDRPLRRLQDFERFAGEWVRVKTKEEFMGRRNFMGVLKGMKGDEICLSSQGEEFRVPLSIVAKARLKGA